MTLTSGQIDDLINVVRETGRREIMPHFRNLAPDSVQIKADIKDLVTDADRAAERAIATATVKMLPQAVFVGEEAVADRPELLEAMEQSSRLLKMAKRPLACCMILCWTTGFMRSAVRVPISCAMERSLARWHRDRNGRLTWPKGFCLWITMQRKIGQGSCVPLNRSARLRMCAVRVTNTACWHRVRRISFALLS